MTKAQTRVSESNNGGGRREGGKRADRLNSLAAAIPQHVVNDWNDVSQALAGPSSSGEDVVASIPCLADRRRSV